MSEQHPIFTVLGLKKSVGNFKADDGRNVDYNNIVVTALADYSEKEKQAGAVGQKAVEHKIKGTALFDEYAHQELPCQAQFIFNWDFSTKTPKAILVSLKFLPKGK